MAWQNVRGHDQIVSRFRQSLNSGRLGSTFLFVGPDGIGKKLFALKLAASLLCDAIRNGQRDRLDPCGVCAGCIQVASGSHPDLELISKPADRSYIPVDLLIGDKAHRMREGLCARIAMRPSVGTRKVAIIDDADFLNLEGANCLLKTLEEPPAGSMLILIGTSPERQLPTIRSRCQIVRFQPLDSAILESLLMASGAIEDAARARMVIGMAGGSLSEAEKWNDEELWEFRESLFHTLAGARWDSQKLAKSTAEFVDSAGKEAPKRRARLRLVIDMMLEFYRQVMRQSVGAAPSGDRRLDEAVQSRLAGGSIDPEIVAACIERTSDARLHVDANANQATNIDAWIDDLSQILVSG